MQIGKGKKRAEVQRDAMAGLGSEKKRLGLERNATEGRRRGKPNLLQGQQREIRVWHWGPKASAWAVL